MNWPVTLLRFLLGSVPRTASAMRVHQEVGNLLDRSLSDVHMSHEDYDGPCSPRPDRESGLHVCPRCDSRLVQPVRWRQTASLARWRLWRRCPECQWWSNGIHDLYEIDAFDDVLELGGEALERELKQLEREGIREIADVFSAALAADLITADDFRL